MTQSMSAIYETKAAQTDSIYRGWITEVNYISLMQCGASIYGHTTLTPRTMRRWYLENLTPLMAVKRAQKGL